jgi:hypothetical protein
VLGQFPKAEKKVLCLDRTNWCFGKLSINIMALGLAHQGTAFGLLWSLLAKLGNSNQLERIALMKRLFKLLPAEQIKALVADREFIGKDWFAFLQVEQIKFHIRIRKNMLTEVGDVPGYIYALFKHLPQGQALTLHKRHFICAQWLYVTGMKLEGGDYLLIVTNANPKESLVLYAQRWEIEQFFKAIKKTGFNFETTHLTNLDRIDSLLSLVTIAFVWAHRCGEHLHTYVKAIKCKKHGYLAQSFFRYGLDYLRSIISHLHLKVLEFRHALMLLSCT